MQSPGRQTLDTQIATEKRLAQVDVLDLDLDFVDLSLRLLCAAEPAAGAEE